MSEVIVWPGSWRKPNMWQYEYLVIHVTEIFTIHNIIDCTDFCGINSRKVIDWDILSTIRELKWCFYRPCILVVNDIVSRQHGHVHVPLKKAKLSQRVLNLKVSKELVHLWDRSNWRLYVLFKYGSSLQFRVWRVSAKSFICV